MIPIMCSEGVTWKGEPGELHCDLWDRAGRPPNPEFGYIMADGTIRWRPSTPYQQWHIGKPK